MRPSPILVVTLTIVLLGGGYLVGHTQGQSVVIDDLNQIVHALRVEYVPHPRDIVNLKEGVPFTVPQGKILVIRDWAMGYYHGSMIITVNGQRIYAVSDQENDSKGLPFGSFRLGFVAHSGEVVALDSGWPTSTAYASGYLADE